MTNEDEILSNIKNSIKYHIIYRNPTKKRGELATRPRTYEFRKSPIAENGPLQRWPYYFSALYCSKYE